MTPFDVPPQRDVIFKDVEDFFTLVRVLHHENPRIEETTTVQSADLVLEIRLALADPDVLSVEIRNSTAT